MVGSDYQKWVSKLMGFEFEIQYRMGASNQVADALSRKGLDAEMQNMEVGCWKHWNKLREEMAFISRVKKELEVDCNSHREFSLYQGNLYYKNKIFVSHFWMELFRLHGISLKKSTAYHPQSDG